jgi:hypothetical protein
MFHFCEMVQLTSETTDTAFAGRSLVLHDMHMHSVMVKSCCEPDVARVKGPSAVSKAICRDFEQQLNWSMRDHAFTVSL